MRDNQIRDVTFFDLVIKSDPAHAPQKTIKYLAAEIKKLYDTGKTDKWNRKKTQKLYIRDLELTQDYLLLLLYDNDGHAPVASYAHLDTNDQRLLPPEDREGSPETVHILIKINPDHKKKHLVLAEDSHRINRSTIENYLNFLIRSIRKALPVDFEAPHPSGAMTAKGPVLYKYKNNIELQGHPSPNFIKMLESGKLIGIGLETAVKENIAVGDGSFLSPTKKELKLAPISGTWKDSLKDKYKDALSLGKGHGYEHARITFVASDNKSHTVRVDTETQNIIGNSFIKKNRLKGFSSFLANAELKINTEIKTKMLGIL